jgi:hypothetical protein
MLAVIASEKGETFWFFLSLSHSVQVKAIANSIKNFCDAESEKKRGKLKEITNFIIWQARCFWHLCTHEIERREWNSI